MVAFIRTHVGLLPKVKACAQNISMCRTLAAGWSRVNGGRLQALFICSRRAVGSAWASTQAAVVFIVDVSCLASHINSARGLVIFLAFKKHWNVLG